ncbi:hypothetical protein STEG23_037671 [Scotinomys teguina]
MPQTQNWSNLLGTFIMGSSKVVKYGNVDSGAASPNLQYLGSAHSIHSTLEVFIQNTLEVFIHVFPHLVKEINASLHVTILLLLFLALALALVSMGFAILNIIQVPYRAVNGPGGICLWNVLAGGVMALAIGSFMAAVKFHDLTERIANFQERLFQFVVVEEQYEESFWICVASASAHAANLVVVAISQIPLPEIKTKMEEATVTPEDILY